MCLGPGSYNIPSALSDKDKSKMTITDSPKFSFPKCEKLKLEPTPAPGVGYYSPSHKKTLHEAPAFAIGNATKTNTYWEKKLWQRSPGPVYGYTLDLDLADKSKIKKVVSCIA